MTTMLSLRAPRIVRSARPLNRVTEVLGGGSTNCDKVNSDTNAVVIDCRAAQTFADLSTLHSLTQKHAKSHAFRHPGGRVVILRRGPELGFCGSAEAAAVSEALVGFAKSLALENGGKGATVNLLCDRTPLTLPPPRADEYGVDACAAPLDWLLSSKSSYVTGQELSVVAKPVLLEAADEGTAVLITGAARGSTPSTGFQPSPPLHTPTHQHSHAHHTTTTTHYNKERMHMRNIDTQTLFLHSLRTYKVTTRLTILQSLAILVGYATAAFYREAYPSRPLVLVDHPSAAGALQRAAETIGGAVAVPLDVTDDRWHMTAAQIKSPSPPYHAH